MEERRPDAADARTIEPPATPASWMERVRRLHRERQRSQLLLPTSVRPPVKPAEPATVVVGFRLEKNDAAG